MFHNLIDLDHVSIFSCQINYFYTVPTDLKEHMVNTSFEEINSPRMFHSPAALDRLYISGNEIKQRYEAKV